MTHLPAELIKRTRAKQPLSEDEIEFLITSFTRDELPDYQMSAWLMAVYFNGLSEAETNFLTQAMLHSGDVITFPSGFYIDKHSTGGVGDKTSLILGPIVASAGVHVPMMSGRGLGHTGGTLDKLESIPGFRTRLDLDTFRQLVHQHHLCFIGQTQEICPADRRMYALRDVTATVESLPLICASIMSKKLAEGITGLVLDVKVGSGAFMKTEKDALELSDRLTRIGRAAGKKVSTLVTSMEQPLGQWVGNSLEIEECLQILRNEPQAHTLYADTRLLSLELAAEMIRLGGLAKTTDEAMQIAAQELESGRAYEKFAQVCTVQGGRLDQLPRARHQQTVLSPTSGYVTGYDTERVGIAAILLGAGRKQTSDTIDPGAGLCCHKKIGDSVEAQEPLFTLYSSDSSHFPDAQKTLLKATYISLQKEKTPSLIITRRLDQP